MITCMWCGKYHSIYQKCDALPLSDSERVKILRMALEKITLPTTLDEDVFWISNAALEQTK